jgi:RNase P/RNase MRP subunit p30
VKKYLISYDLDKPGKDYHRLIKELERLGALKVLYSEWILRTTNSASEVRDYLKTFTDSNDMLLIVALTGEAAWTSLMVSNDTFKQSIAA